MLVTFILLIYGFLLTHLVGIKIIILLQKWFRFDTVYIPPTGLSNIIGLALMSIVIAPFHLFYKIDLTLHIFLISFVLSSYKSMYIFLQRLGSEIKADKAYYLILLLAAVVAIVIRSGKGDIGDYHLQAINWAENYPNILGIGNFNRPLSNNNCWFNLQAFLGMRFLGVQSVYIGNALFFVSAFLYLLNLKERVRPNWFAYIQLGFLVLSIKTAFVGSVTPDYIITCLVFVCATLYYNYFLEQQKQDGMLLCVFILCCFSITVKLNAFPFIAPALLALWQLVHKKLTHTNFMRLILLGAIFFIPWLIGNIIVSGWLAYPLDSVDLFNVDWKVPKEMLQFERFSIKQWGKNPGEDIYVTAQMSIWQWLPKWFAYHDLFNKCLIIVSLCSAILLLCLRQSYQNKAIRGLLVFGFFGLIFCLSNGPHIRYAFGYMLLLIAMAVQFVTDKFKLEPNKIMNKFLLGGIVAITLLQVVFFMMKEPSQVLLTSIIYPKKYTDEVLPDVKMGSEKVIITNKNNTCWDQFPCTYYMIKGCKLRGTTFSEGFKVEPE